MTTNDKELRERIDKILGNPMPDGSLDAIMQLVSESMRRREAEARINELTYIRAFSGQPYAMSDINDRPLSIPDRIAELTATIRGEGAHDSP